MRRGFVAVGVLALLAGGCGDDGDDAPESGRSGSITVFAAASLSDAFDEIGDAFEEANLDVTVELNYAGSSSLREQILAGAPADVFASADPSTMEPISDDATTFVENQLQIAVAAGNPAGVTGLADFADRDLLIGLCAEEVPCGRFARQALASAGVTPAIDTNEPDVRSLLTKVEAGELDAGIVYVTDVRSSDGVDGIEIPPEHDVVARYPIAALTDSEVAEAFVAFVLSDEGQDILASHGFRTG
jgi:molybdate transport system substrate-binding protein